jgi:DNA ligase-1
VKLAQLVQTSLDLAETRSRQRKVKLLADCLGAMTPDEVCIGVNYLAGNLPQGRIGIGPAMVQDLSVPASLGAELTLADVHAVFDALSGVVGSGARQRRGAVLNDLFSRATGDEQDFLSRLLIGELRQGALEAIAAEAVARAAAIDATVVRRALMLSGELAKVAVVAVTQGRDGLNAMRLRLFRPLQPMLAQAAELHELMPGEGAALALEYKLDGARVQIHRDADEVRVFTRQLNDVTASVPELVEAARMLSASAFVIDGEAIAFGLDGRPLPFQVTMKRFGRRQQVHALRQQLPLSMRAFDCLHVDGEDLLDAPYSQRMQRLEKLVPAGLRIPSCETADPVEAAAFLRRALDDGHEGIMVKRLDSTYQAGSRGADWRKIKPVHTLDLVVLAAEWGSGRRKGWLSNLHLGARDPASDGFVMLGKTFKGLTDKLLAWQTDELLARETGRDGNIVHVRPELVVEIAFNDVQRSEQYPGGMALRFARVRGYRDDKSAAMADTLDAVEQIHRIGLRTNAA